MPAVRPLAVLIDPAGQNHGLHGIAVGQRLPQGLEDYGASAFGPHVAVAASVKAPAPSIGRKHVGLAEPDEGGLHQQHIDPAHDGGFHLAAAQDSHA